MGYNTCILAMNRNKVKLLIICSDISENSLKKLRQTAEDKHVTYRIYGLSDDISQMCGTTGKSVFGITDKNFAESILKEIDSAIDMK